MNIKPGVYVNILDLYKKSSDFKQAFDMDKGKDIVNYMDDYSDRDGIVAAVLQDVLYTGTYKFKVSKHHHWREVQIQIIKK